VAADEGSSFFPTWFNTYVSKTLVKSPLRYPGGKSKAIDQILEYIPETFSEYREPFIGGGSLFIYLKQTRPDIKFWINDLNLDLYSFWLSAQQNIDTLTNAVWKIKRERKDGRKLFTELTAQSTENLSTFERAVRFFVLNRITFSGTVEAGGYSQKAFETRFTDTSVERLYLLGQLLDGVRITNLDYKEVLKPEGEEVFTFFDPPYLSATKSKLYGKKGTLHTGFNHVEFAETLKSYRHNWLITYDDSEGVRNNFSFANIYEWELQYGMNNYKRESAAKGKELFISNYEARPKG
jgi:DNA adenine methylase